MKDYGTVRPGTTLYFYVASYAASTGASSAMTGLATSDIKVYKAGSTTERASTSGYTLLDTDGLDFDGVIGLNGFSIDLADNTTSGFWTAGSDYTVVVSTVTVDSQTVTFIAGTFRIGYPDAIINTTIATLASQTSFTLTAGPAEDDALNGCVVCIHDIASAVQLGFAAVSDYTGATKTVTLGLGVSFTAAAGDNIGVLAPSNAKWVGGANQGVVDLAATSSEVDSIGSLVSTTDIALRGLLGTGRKSVGATGNTTTTIHLASDTTYADDEINDQLLMIYDASEAEYHSRWIDDFAAAGDLATVATLPFTPASGDYYWVLPIRRDVLSKSLTEIGQGTPAATTTLETMIRYLYKAFRNKKTQTASQWSLYADDTTTIDQKAAVGDDGTTTTIGEVASGP